MHFLYGQTSGLIYRLRPKEKQEAQPSLGELTILLVSDLQGHPRLIIFYVI